MTEDQEMPEAEKLEVIVAADSLFEILEALPSPAHAANALAQAHARLCVACGGETEAEVRAMMKEMTEAVLGLWSHGTNKGLAQ